MTPRDTSTGNVLEQMILPALSMGGYIYEKQVNVGFRPSGRKHIIDVLAKKDTKKILISLKWQQISGTAEQKIPFEVICLSHILISGAFSKAYLVLGGSGWSLRDFYTNGGLNPFLKLPFAVKIMKLEDFIAIANQGRL